MPLDMCSVQFGFAGYRANHVQFGLDQLLDAPNEYQGLFVHWIQTFTILGFTIMEILMALYKCQYTYQAVAKNTFLSSHADCLFFIPHLFYCYW